MITSGAIQFLIGFVGFWPVSSASRMTGLQTRLYEWMTTRVPGWQCAADAVEERDEVVDERQDVGEDDVVERLAQVEALARHGLEAELRMPRARELDEARAHVDAYADRGLERGQELSRAAADLEDARAGRDLEVMELRDPAVVGAVAAPPLGLLRGEVVEEGRELAILGPDGLGRLAARLPCSAPYGSSGGDWTIRASAYSSLGPKRRARPFDDEGADARHVDARGRARRRKLARGAGHVRRREPALGRRLRPVQEAIRVLGHVVDEAVHQAVVTDVLDREVVEVDEDDLAGLQHLARDQLRGGVDRLLLALLPGLHLGDGPREEACDRDPDVERHARSFPPPEDPESRGDGDGERGRVVVVVAVSRRRHRREDQRSEREEEGPVGAAHEAHAAGDQAEPDDDDGRAQRIAAERVQREVLERLDSFVDAAPRERLLHRHEHLDPVVEDERGGQGETEREREEEPGVEEAEDAVGPRDSELLDEEREPRVAEQERRSRDEDRPLVVGLHDREPLPVEDDAEHEPDDCERHQPEGVAAGAGGERAADLAEPARPRHAPDRRDRQGHDHANRGELPRHREAEEKSRRRVAKSAPAVERRCQEVPDRDAQRGDGCVGPEDERDRPEPRGSDEEQRPGEPPRPVPQQPPDGEVGDERRGEEERDRPRAVDRARAVEVEQLFIDERLARIRRAGGFLGQILSPESDCERVLGGQAGVVEVVRVVPDQDVHAVADVRAVGVGPVPPRVANGLEGDEEGRRGDRHHHSGKGPSH